ncbi:MAG: large conductance mechanosensitive channel protein MscL [Kiloniellaceae bacterium]
MLKEFKDFAMRGNVMDMAIGIVIGAAFGKIVTSFVSDILMPPIGLLLGGVDFSSIFVVLGEGEYASLEAAKEAGAATWNVGVFINTLIDFMIIAFAIFLVVKAINNMKRKEEAAPPAPTEKACPHCATNIPIKANRCPNCTSQLEAA